MKKEDIEREALIHLCKGYIIHAKMKSDAEVSGNKNLMEWASNLKSHSEVINPVFGFLKHYGIMDCTEEPHASLLASRQNDLEALEYALKFLEPIKNNRRAFLIDKEQALFHLERSKILFEQSFEFE